MKVNVGFLVAYDYELLKISIPLVYKDAHKIVLAVDENQNSWSGNYFEIDVSFFDWIKKIDIENKITVYKDNFYIPGNTAMQNETRERNLLASEMGEGLCVQLDADEFFLDFKGFVAYLKRHEKKLSGRQKIQICAYMSDVYKKVENGFLFVNEVTCFYLGTNRPDYIRGRKNKEQQKWYVPFQLAHFTWSRSEEELKFKIENWGHNKDFNPQEFLKLWKSVTKDNFTNFKGSFHPFNKKWWNELIYVKGATIQDVLSKNEFPTIISKFEIFTKNLGQKIKFLFR